MQMYTPAMSIIYANRHSNYYCHRTEANRPITLQAGESASASVPEDDEHFPCLRSREKNVPIKSGDWTVHELLTAAAQLLTASQLSGAGIIKLSSLFVSSARDTRACVDSPCQSRLKDAWPSVGPRVEPHVLEHDVTQSWECSCICLTSIAPDSDSKVCTAMETSTRVSHPIHSSQVGLNEFPEKKTNNWEKTYTFIERYIVCSAASPLLANWWFFTLLFRWNMRLCWRL